MGLVFVADLTNQASSRRHSVIIRCRVRTFVDPAYSCDRHYIHGARAMHNRFERGHINARASDLVKHEVKYERKHVIASIAICVVRRLFVVVMNIRACDVINRNQVCACLQSGEFSPCV